MARRASTTSGDGQAGDTPHALLRRATDPCHRAAEQALSRFDLRAPAGYGAFLRAQAAAVVPLEAAAERHGVAGLLPDWPLRRRTPAMLADLDRLGLETEQAAPLTLDGDPLGVAYVLEGSRHGARLLLRRVLAGGDPVAVAATAFLRQPVDLTRWSTLLDAVNARGATASGLSGLTRAAVFAFDLFRHRAIAVYDDLPEGSPSAAAYRHDGEVDAL